ncbi:FtsW/RodA/SpoVE family cell cycle protein [Candidatus Peregrinibacteria bacterium]|nr:MAG: FtsW/RodA/SpoVE family cell cycle protein [Candidatus Peregrinibacteria bacterium]
MKHRPIDTSLALTIIGLVLFGIAMISSVSVYESYELTNALVNKGLAAEPSNSFYLWRHLARAIIAVPIGVMMLAVPLNVWRKIALPFFVVGLVMLVALFLPVIGANYGTATSWLNIPFLPSIQPSEFVKLAIIFYLAVWMEKRQELVHSFQYGFLPFTILLSAVVVLLALQPDFGSILVISSIATVMFYAAGGSLLHIIGG